MSDSEFPMQIECRICATASPLFYFDKRPFLQAMEQAGGCSIDVYGKQLFLFRFEDTLR